MKVTGILASTNFGDDKAEGPMAVGWNFMGTEEMEQVH